MIDRIHGIDVSHHNTSVDWATISKTSQFVIARASYGSQRDRMTVQHLARARAAGMKVGLYVFFRPTQPVLEQFDAFNLAAAAAGYNLGDIIPAVDVEPDTYPHQQPVLPEWEPNVRELCTALARSYGDCMVYTTQAAFGDLGKPAWLLEHPLWVAHWTAASKPATPGNKPWAFWQYNVGPYQPGSTKLQDKVAGALDHNYAIAPLPIVRPPTLPPLDPADPSVVAARQLDLTEGISGHAARDMQADLQDGQTESGSNERH